MAYSVDRKRRSLIRIIVEGGDPASGFFPGRNSVVANRFRVSNQFVSKLWQNFCTTGEHLPPKKKSSNPSHLLKRVSFNHSPLRTSIFVFPAYSVHRTSDLQVETN